jgi:SAM-dependent methyltransferase
MRDDYRRVRVQNGSIDLSRDREGNWRISWAPDEATRIFPPHILTEDADLPPDCPDGLLGLRRPPRAGIASRAMDRATKILAEIPRGTRVLELGPSFSPIAPKSEGWDSCTVDHASREALVEKYRSDPTVDVSRIEDVDVVWDSGPLDEALPTTWRGTFDAFIGSHVLEHIPDPIGLLQSLERILKPSGVVSLVIPDKRFCFDFFKPISTTGELLAAHERRASRHSRKTLFDHVAYGVTSAGSICWGRQPVTELAFSHSLVDAKLHVETYGSNEDGPYVDSHAWHFTPSSFQLAMLELAALEAIDYSIERRFSTDGCEFYVTLRRGRQVPANPEELQSARLDLLRRTFTEVGEQIDLLAGAAAAPPTPVAAVPPTVREIALRSARARARALASHLRGVTSRISAR